MTGNTLAPPGVSLTREVVERLAQSRAEPDWLRQRRLEAFDAFERMPMPDQRTEGWRRTSLSGLSLEHDWAASPPSLSIDAPAGARVLPLHDALADAELGARIREHLGRSVPADADKFTALHYALLNAGVVIQVTRNSVLEEPIWIRHSADAPALIHTLLMVEESGQATVVEEFTGSAGLASGVVEQAIGANASVRYVQLQRWAPETWSFSTQRAELERDAHLRTLNVALGARLARNTVQVALNGRGSQADLLGIVNTIGRQHVDFQTLQDHSGDATRSDLVIHNALRDRSSSNFTGLIRINKSARQTESSQEQKNILLSPRAKADSDPKLEILNNDVVRCTHGASVGPMDAEMLFYLQSRGLDLPSAERLIVDGFFQSVIQKLGQPVLQDAIWSAIE